MVWWFLGYSSSGKNKAIGTLLKMAQTNQLPQTALTLNERFRILKDQRSSTAQSGKGSRFVTVG